MTGWFVNGQVGMIALFDATTGVTISWFPPARYHRRRRRHTCLDGADERLRTTSTCTVYYSLRAKLDRSEDDPGTHSINDVYLTLRISRATLYRVITTRPQCNHRSDA